MENAVIGATHFNSNIILFMYHVYVTKSRREHIPLILTINFMEIAYAGVTWVNCVLKLEHQIIIRK